MKKYSGVIVVIVLAVTLQILGGVLSADAETEGKGWVYVPPTATPVPAEHKEAEDVETVEEEEAVVQAAPTITPTPIPRELLQEENGGCIGDDGLVW
jgi:hypothetical protein